MACWTLMDDPELVDFTTGTARTAGHDDFLTWCRT